MSKSYRPSNGSEGDIFDHYWCEGCARDAEFRSGPDVDPALGCQILSNSLAYDIRDPEFPKAWIENDDGSNPRCTAFTTEPSKPMRCENTPDLFEVSV